MLLESFYRSTFGFVSAGVEETDLDAVMAFFREPDDRIYVTAVVVTETTVEVHRSYRASGILAERNVLLFESEEEAYAAGECLRGLVG